MKKKIQERIHQMQNCLGMEVRIADILSFTSSFWENIRYQNRIDQTGETDERKN